ncbi:hypothetical protein HZU77_004470 [Neisseriaceae bacterium TC5R-5]|nr:hypothetical protein [Neisseriaceae bacterium TC5R-5]
MSAVYFPCYPWITLLLSRHTQENNLFSGFYIEFYKVSNRPSWHEKSKTHPSKAPCNKLVLKKQNDRTPRHKKAKIFGDDCVLKSFTCGLCRLISRFAAAWSGCINKTRQIIYSSNHTMR